MVKNQPQTEFMADEILSVADFSPFMLLKFDATDEESPLLLYDFTYLNFGCQVDFGETPTKTQII